MLIYGRNPVFEALRNGEVLEVLVAKGIEPRVVRELEEYNLPLKFIPRIEMDQMVGSTQHQGLIAEVADLHFSEVDDILDLAEQKGEQVLMVLLDGITDPRNFGAIIRSAEVLGAHGVVVEERRSAPLSAVVAKTAAGATAYLPIAQVKNMARFIDQLKEHGVWVYGAAGEARMNITQVDYDRPLALVIGSEGDGMRRLVRDKCDELVSIPIQGKIQSLNASVAASILIYQAVQSRGK
ncbi:23S rRNA (guanosine(2251)-2'-O)-methyltransferase RlmB [Deinococcus roseus]|uniref:23S rRNA (Guanosine(2251)-2'-O)-methyltransferase RlmB n=1 Tax=Deinococcus roseus TaxID=392414 RepID=A0ABQ2CU82_9DEIO|nr:23S rRNA (guanosine(2251)-2'-O)-methyltransferase RlmB [Deinococcus roseus]GGJ21294.1 23S rRNA (guanosine(2251)-2'-O)-methyltransferase RlmB [Deinococcus roseus]